MWIITTTVKLYVIRSNTIHLLIISVLHKYRINSKQTPGLDLDNNLYICGEYIYVFEHFLE